MLHVVIDTNILIRVLIRSAGSDGRVFEKFLNGTITLYYSHALIRELTRVIAYPRIGKKYSFTTEKTSLFVAAILDLGKLVEPQETITLCRDPEDNAVLSLAHAAARDESVFLVTADDDLLVLEGKLANVNILTPQDFLKRKFSRR